MNKSFKTSQNFIKDLSTAEHLILWLNVEVCIGLFIAQIVWFGKDAYGSWMTWVTLIATICSIMSSMAGVKQRVLCPIFGLISTCMLIAVAWGHQLFGSMIMYGINAIFQIIALVGWFKSSKNKVTVEARHAKWRWCIVYVAVLIGLTALFTWVEGLNGFVKFWSGGQEVQPKALYIRIFDAANLMFTIGCFWPYFRRYDQVWYMYILDDIAILMVNLLNAIDAFKNGNNQIGFTSITVACSALFLCLSCICGILNWSKAVKKSSKC